jgi:hypothetical protein
VAYRTFTIARLLWFVVACAVVQGVVLAPNAVTGTLFALSILGILVTSLLAIAYRCGRRRAAWIGFAAFGWSMGLPLFWAMWSGPGFRGPDHLIIVAFWTLVPIFGFVGSIVALRLYDTRDAAIEPAPAPAHEPTRHPLDFDLEPQTKDTPEHAR